MTMLPALRENDLAHIGQEGAAPTLPVERHLVAAVRALEAAKLQIEQTLLLLQWCPRDEFGLYEAFAALEASVVSARASSGAYHEIRHCQGQA